MVAGSIELVVARSDPSARRSFMLERGTARVVLDLLAAAATEDPTIAYRYSCRSGFCGTCTVLLDGRPVLACQTPLPSGGRADVAPLGGFPIVRDLVVDPAPFTDRWTAIGPAIAPPVASPPAVSPAVQSPAPASPAVQSPAPASPAVQSPAPASPAVQSPAPASPAPAADSLDCISCGACVAACDLTAMDRAFLGPAALTRAMVTIADRRDTTREHRLAVVGGRDGVDGCHGIATCSLACPRGLDPARAIRRLRRWRIRGLP